VVGVRGFGYLSQAIQRALDVLEILAGPPVANRGLTLTELSASLSLPKSTTLRLLANLEARGLVEQDDSRRYRIGLRLFSIGSQALAGNDVRRQARPYLEELAYKVGESAYLAILDQDHALYIDRIESPQPVLKMSPIGSHRPLHATAVGKVLMSSLDPEVVEGIISRTGLPALTPNTVTDPEVLKDRLELIRQRAFDVEHGEYSEALTCMAAPIRDATSRVVAAIGLSGPSWRLEDERLVAAITALGESARSISRELGHSTLDAVSTHEQTPNLAQSLTKRISRQA